MNFSEQTISLRTAMGMLLILLAVMGSFYLGFLIYRRSQSQMAGGSNAGSATSDTSVVANFANANANSNANSNSAPLILLPPITTLEPIIKPCLFVFYKSCAQAAQPDQPTQSPPASPTDYTATVETDLFTVISQQPGKDLATTTVPLSQQQVALLFPEYLADSHTKQVQLPVVLVLHRVAAKYNLNPRLMLLLTEVMNQGRGLFFSPSPDLTQPFFTVDQPTGFVTQLLSVVNELHAAQVSYSLNNKMPTTLTFYDRQYTVSPKMNNESLALMAFLSQHFSNRQVWERAVSPISTQKSADYDTVKTTNFIALYKFIFAVDPSK